MNYVTGESPTEEVFADLLLWCGGALLIVPGLLTDALGLVIFIPVVREESIRWLRKRVQKSLGLPPLELNTFVLI